MYSACEHYIGLIEFFGSSLKLEEGKKGFADPRLLLLAFMALLGDGEQINRPPLDTLDEKLVV